MGPSSQGANRFFARTHFLACEDVAGGSQQLGGRIVFLPGRTSLRPKVSLVGPGGHWGESFFFARTHFLACEDVASGSQQSGGNFFSRNTVARPVGPRCQVEE